MRISNKFLALASAAFLLALQPGCGGEGENPPEDPGQTEPPDNFESRREGESLNTLESRWKQAASGRTTGSTATLDVTGSSLLLSTQGQAQVDAPVVLLPQPRSSSKPSYLFFRNARVGNESGFLALEGTRIELTAGTLGNVDIRSAVARTKAEDGSPSPAVELTTMNNVTESDPAITFPADWSDASSGLFFSDPAVIHGSNFTLTGFTRGVFITAAGSTPITGTVTVAASDVMFWYSTSRLEVTETKVASPKFALGGAVEAGTLTVTGLAPISPPPSMLKGRQAQVVLRPGSAKIESQFTLTQAVTAQGMVLPADVEIAFDPQPVTVKKDQRTLIPVVFREKGLLGDAVITNLQITGSGKDVVSVSLDRVEPFVEKLWNDVADMGITAPFLAIPLMPLTPFIAIGEALVCLFSTCPEAYPVWVDAGKAARFHIIVQGKLAPGTYEATVTLTGRNYAPLTIPVQFTITE